MTDLIIDTATGSVREGEVKGCQKCRHLACVCEVKRRHPDPKCHFRISTICAVPIECDHGYDVCPKCDPCTCGS